MDELKMTGNCLKGSRGILSFDAAFEETEWGRLTKELFTHVSDVPYVSSRRGVLIVGTVRGKNKIFGVPPQARRAKPFIDHVLTFSILDSKIWFRNFQVRHASKLSRLLKWK
jgi:ribosome biogenesis protein BRX1